MTGPFSQHGHRVRLEWGPAGVALLAASCEIVVIVDVLSFSTAVDVAVSRGATVIPVRWHPSATSDLASEASWPGVAAGESPGAPPGRTPDAAPEVVLPEGAVLAGRRSLSSWSLSPSSLTNVPPGLRLALPSPNGATLSATAASSTATVLAGCLRNAPAVAAAAAGYARGRRRFAEAGAPEPPAHPAETVGTHVDGHGVIGVAPAGERWPDGSLRPALEDLLGAGAVVAELARLGIGPCSPEALAAADAFSSARSRGLRRTLEACSSGRELAESGFRADVALAAEYGVSDATPMLRDGAYGSPRI